MKKQYYNVETYQAKESLGYLIRRSRNLITQGLERLFNETFVGEEITFAQWVVLMCLRDGLASTPAELCQYICYDTGAFTRLIDQMEKRGMVTRSRSTRDRRMVQLQLTDKGTDTIARFIGTVVEFYNGLLINFSEEEADTLVRLLTKLVNNLSENRKKGN